METTADTLIEKPIVIHEVQPLTEAMLDHEVIADLTLRQFLTEHCTVLVGTVGGMYSIYETKSRQGISLLDENRTVMETHVQSLMKSYEEDGYYFTTLNLNEKLKEIDGQHRFESAMRKGLPVRFMIMPTWGIKEVTVLNVNSRNWKPVDFMESYAQQGNPNYIRFKEFFDANEFDISTCQLIIFGKRSKANAAEDEFRSGAIQVDDQMIVRASQKARKIKQLEKFHPRGWKSRSCTEAMLILFNTAGYDHDELIDRMEKYPEMTLIKANSLRVGEYIDMFVEKYNLRRQKGKLEVLSRN